MAEDIEKSDFGFRVEIKFSPVPGAKERLRRAFSLVLRADKQSSESHRLDPTETQETADFDPSACEGKPD